MSFQTFGGICLIAVLCSWVADAQTTVRPYKFGFNIEEQQHRSEKRDERGIVMGEFGFITADGIYHVTVYATDENGKFRILAMRSYPYEAQPKIIEMVVAPKPKPQTPTKDVAKFNFNTMACSGCFLTNAAPKPPSSGGFATTKPKTQIQTLSKPLARISPGAPAKALVPGTLTKVGVQRTMAEKALTQVLSDVKISDRLEVPIRSTVAGGVKHVKDVIRMADTSQNHRHQQDAHRVHTQTKSNPTHAHPLVSASASASALATTTQHNKAQEYPTNKDHLHTAETAPVQQIELKPPFSTQNRFSQINTHTNIHPNTNKQIPQSTATRQQLTKTTTSKVTPHTNFEQQGVKTPDQQIKTYTQGNGAETTSFVLPNDIAKESNSAGLPSLGQADTLKPPIVVPNKAGAGPAGTFKGIGVQQSDKRPSLPGSIGVVSGTGPAGTFKGTGIQQTDKRPSVPGSIGVVSGKAPSGTNPVKGLDGDLYRFKYRLDYHGHTETGSRNGNKVGSYSVIGDDNVERTLEYIANENGYYPKIKWRRLDTPVVAKENTLKESEFVWFNDKE